jgi:predicted acylesterase/phospholipase RssA
VHVIHAGLPSLEKEYIAIDSTVDKKKKMTVAIENLSHRIAEYLNRTKNETISEKPSAKNDHPKIAEISQNTVHIAQDVIAKLQIELYKPELVIEPDTRQITLYEFYRGEEAVKIGYEEARKVLAGLT